MANAQVATNDRLCGQHISIHNPNNDTVSAIHRCETDKALKLCIFDTQRKLICNRHYDIGGTYLNGESDFWFYFTTTSCPKQMYLLNLFVRCKTPRNFSIGISDSVNINVPELTDKYLILPENLKWYSFRSVDNKENHYIKTFCFATKHDKELNNLILLIPICIKSETGLVLNEDIIKSIKLQHDLSTLLTKQEKTDFLLTSADGSKFPTHKLILGAHSSVFRDLIKEDTDSLFIDINDKEMGLLLQFIYTGTIKDISNQDSRQLLDIAKRFKVHTLFLLTQYMLGGQIDVDNVIEIATVAKKFNLDDLLCKATEFIKNHPEVMKTKAWKDLDNIDLMKYFFEQMNYKKRC